jgi:DNA helicase-2/ATP-dependent DNA helicase PcrA
MVRTKKKQFVIGSPRHRKALTIDYASALNAEQLAAAQAPPGPLLVIAGAGTGKTRLITYRVAYLLETGARPEEILLLTFTNKAAREMMTRVESLAARDVQQIWGGTFHHIAHRILRTHAGALGYKPGYTILDRDDARSLLRAVIAERKRGRGDKRFPQAQVLESIHSLAVNTQTHADEIIAGRYVHLTARTEAILEVLRAYDERKLLANAMDYDDLLWNWLKLLGEDAFRQLLRARFTHVLVDEYQDTNALQGSIIDLLCSPDRSLSVVGDDAQAIYGWRGALDTNMLAFPERYPGCRVCLLETNYRSTPEILEVANRAIAANPRRFEKNLVALRRSGTRPEVVACADAFQQSRFIAECVTQIHDEGIKLEDIVVLYRSHWNAMELQLELQRRGLPFQIRGGIRFFEQAHIKDATSFLRAVENPRDELAWLRVLPLVQHVGPSRARAVAQILETTATPLGSLASAAVTEAVGTRAREAFALFAQLMSRIATDEMRAAPAEMLRLVVEEFYGEYLESRYENARQRREDLAQLALYAAQFESAERFLAELAISGVVEAEASAVGTAEQGAMTLSTVHQAKGLEWQVVFIIWLADERFPSAFASRVPGGYEEERRLFHVALTRARDRLVLVYPMVYRPRGTGPVFLTRSRFLAELDEPGPPPYDVVEVVERPAPTERPADADASRTQRPRLAPADASATPVVRVKSARAAGVKAVEKNVKPAPKTKKRKAPRKARK